MMIESIINENILQRKENVAEWKKIANSILILKWKSLNKRVGEYKHFEFIEIPSITMRELQHIN